MFNYHAWVKKKYTNQLHPTHSTSHFSAPQPSTLHFLNADAMPFWFSRLRKPLGASKIRLGSIVYIHTHKQFSCSLSVYNMVSKPGFIIGNWLWPNQKGTKVNVYVTQILCCLWSSCLKAGHVSIEVLLLAEMKVEGQMNNLYAILWDVNKNDLTKKTVTAKLWSKKLIRTTLT